MASRHLCRNSALVFLKVVTAKRVYSESLVTSIEERGTTIGAIVSYDFRKSFLLVVGTTIRWVSRYSESWIMTEGSTTGVRDFVTRFPLP